MLTNLSISPIILPQNQITEPVIDWEIVHQIPGRLRIRIPRLIWDDDYRNRLQRFLLKTRAIKESRVSGAAGCIIVSYEEEQAQEWAILEYLKRVIQLAAKEPEKNDELEPVKVPPNLTLPALAMLISLIGTPLEWPLLITGGAVLVASFPLWQKMSQIITTQGKINIDCLDIIWLSAQLIGGNHIAGALALNFGAMAENLRRDRLEKLENELYVLFEQEDEEIHWLCDRQNFAPVRLEDKEKWIYSVEETALMQQVKPIAEGVILPTLLMSGGIGLLTNDLGRASAVLPLDVGVSLRGVTPLAVVSALTEAARAGVYIRNGKTLEKLAKVDTLVFSLKSFISLTTNPETLKVITQLQRRSFSFYVVIDEDEGEAQPLNLLGDKVYLREDRKNLDQLMDKLHQEGRTTAWIDDTTGDDFTTTQAEVIISLAQGCHESQADVILHHHDLRSLVYSLELAKHTLATAYESLAIALIPNLIAVSIGVFFGLNPIIAVIINGGSAILAELNSLRSGIVKSSE